MQKRKLSHLDTDLVKGIHFLYIIPSSKFLGLTVSQATGGNPKEKNNNSSQTNNNNNNINNCFYIIKYYINIILQYAYVHHVTISFLKTLVFRKSCSPYSTNKFSTSLAT